MSYGVSFGSGHRRRRHITDADSFPYDHWVQRGKPSGAVFKHSDNFGDDVIKWYLMPAEGLAYVDSYAEFSVEYLRLYAQLTFDEAEKKIEVERILCERKNYWEEDAANDRGTGSGTGTGGVEYYRRNLEDLGDDFVSFELLAARFFAPSWTVLALPPTLPRITDEAMLLAEQACPDDYRYGPWGITVGVYHDPVDRVSAARTIQRCFRGWRVRMKTAFDPRTSLGAHYAMRGFAELNGSLLSASLLSASTLKGSSYNLHHHYTKREYIHK